MEKQNHQELAMELNELIKNYNELTRVIQQIKNRWNSTHGNQDYQLSDILNGKEDTKGNLKNQGLEQIKDRQTRKIKKFIGDFPIYSDWLDKVPGIGPAIGGGLIRLYYYRFLPVCKCGQILEKRDNTFWCSQCNKSVKGDGNLKYKVELRDFPTISSWWHFMGRHNDGDGKMPKRKKGTQIDPITGEKKSLIDWSPAGRNLGFQIRESMNRAGGHYRDYSDKRKRYRENSHPDASKGYRHNMAWNETVKLFLSHFWQVAHEIDGLPMTQPWSVQHGGHDANHIIQPYYWNGN